MKACQSLQVEKVWCHCSVICCDCCTNMQYALVAPDHGQDMCIGVADASLQCCALTLAQPFSLLPHNTYSRRLISTMCTWWQQGVLLVVARHRLHFGCCSESVMTASSTGLALAAAGILLKTRRLLCFNALRAVPSTY